MGQLAKTNVQLFLVDELTGGVSEVGVPSAAVTLTGQRMINELETVIAFEPGDSEKTLKELLQQLEALMVRQRQEDLSDEVDNCF